MKSWTKRIVAISLTLITAFVLYFVFKMLPDIYFNIGKQAYDAKNYKEAYSNLKTAVKLSPKNRDARYYYVQTLMKFPPNLEIQKEFFRISQVNQPDSADLIADRQISTWRNQISLNSGENYIEQVPFNDKILRWDLAKLPLNVCIKVEPQSNVPAYYKSAFKRAFQQWQASTGYIKFNFIENSDEAQIIVDIMPASQRAQCKEADCKYIMAFTIPQMRGDLLDTMKITFYDANNLNQPFSEREIYNTSLHEIAHALGIMGHSYSKDDLMYMQYNSSENYAAFRSDFQSISQTDLNTLRLLYRLIPDITNAPLSQFDTRGQFFAPIVLGDNEQVNSRKLLEAKNYIEAAPNLPNGYIDMASAYSEQKQYNDAVESLNKALSLSSNDPERFLCYYNLAIVYMKLQDWDNSLKYANLAKQTRPPQESSSEIDGLIAAINFNKGDVGFAKQAYIETLQSNPGSALDAINLARIYIKEFNFVQAGKTLNRMVEANPEEKNNPKVKAYGLIMFLFK